MKQAAAKSTTTKEKGGSKTDISGLTIAIQLLDTSWRVALPIVGLVWLGSRYDKQQGTTPMFTLLGFFVSIILVTWLVYKQIRTLYPDIFKKEIKK